MPKIGILFLYIMPVHQNGEKKETAGNPDGLCTGSFL